MLVNYYTRIVILWIVFSHYAGAVRQHPQEGNPGDTIILWNDQTLDTVRNERLGAFDAARLYAMVNVAMFDALLACFPKISFDPVYVVAGESFPANASDGVAAASAAAHTVLTLLYPNRSDVYDAQLADILNATDDEEQQPAVVRGTSEWGEVVGNTVVSLRKTDGSTPKDILPGGTDPGQFRNDFGSAAFRTMDEFVVNDALEYISMGPPPLDSLEYAAHHNEVRLLGGASFHNPKYDEIFSFWKAGGGSVRPPGEWIKVAQVVAAQEGVTGDILETSTMFTALSTALADVSIAVVFDKYTHQFWRPTSAIREANTDGNNYTVQDTGWAPRNGGSGSSPEHTSGQSAFAGCASAILAQFFKTDNIEFTFEGDNAIAGNRTFSSFGEAAAEAGRSRIYAGIHFEFSNQDGQKTGRGIAREAIGFWQDLL